MEILEIYSRRKGIWKSISLPPLILFAPHHPVACHGGVPIIQCNEVIFHFQLSSCRRTNKNQGQRMKFLLPSPSRNNVLEGDGKDGVRIITQQGHKSGGNECKQSLSKLNKWTAKSTQVFIIFIEVHLQFLLLLTVIHFRRTLSRFL